MTTAYDLEQLLRSEGLPVLMTSVGDPDDPATVEVTLAPEATPAQRQRAAQIVAVWPLEAARREKLAAIDARTRSLFARGLSVDAGAPISLSEAAQINFLSMDALVRDGFSRWPRGWSRQDGGEYLIQDLADWQRLKALYVQRVAGVQDAGRALRGQVLAAETLEQINAVTDTRE